MERHLHVSMKSSDDQTLDEMSVIVTGKTGKQAESVIGTLLRQETIMRLVDIILLLADVPESLEDEPDVH